jgi:hypothetical protein
MPDEERPVTIPAALYARIESLLPSLGYPTVDAFVVHAVRAVLSTAETTPATSPADEAQIVERLRRLGYID